MAYSFAADIGDLAEILKSTATSSNHRTFVIAGTPAAKAALKKVSHCTQSRRSFGVSQATAMDFTTLD